MEKSKREGSMNMWALISLIRLHNSLLAGTAALVGAVVAGGSISFGVGLAVLATVSISGGGYAINDYVDRHVDSVNNPDRPIPSGAMDAPKALKVSFALFALGVILAVFINLACFLIAAFNAILLAYYAFNLKREGFLGNLSIGYLVGSIFLFGGLAIGDITIAGILAAIAALSTCGRELIKDIEDIRGDQVAGSNSFPLTYGRSKAAVLAVILTGIAIALSPIPYWIGVFGGVYLAVLTVSIVIFLAGIVTIARKQERENASRSSWLYKVAMIFGVIAFLAGAL